MSDYYPRNPLSPIWVKSSTGYPAYRANIGTFRLDVGYDTKIGSWHYSILELPEITNSAGDPFVDYGYNREENAMQRVQRSFARWLQIQLFRGKFKLEER